MCGAVSVVQSDMKSAWLVDVVVPREDPVGNLSVGVLIVMKYAYL
jgi:hypothetical protein